MEVWLSPIRGGWLPVCICVYIAWPIHSTVASSIDTSIVAPSPVRHRRSSAARTACAQYMPAAMSAVGIPVFTGVSGVPVIETSPASA